MIFNNIKTALTFMFFLLIFSSCSRNQTAGNEKENDNNFLAIPPVKNVFVSSANPLSKEQEIAAIPTQKKEDKR